MDTPLLKKGFHRRELEALKFFQTKELSGASLLVAVSGGLDSMSLWALLTKLEPVMNFKIHVAHIHHGPSRQKKQSQFRDQCFQNVSRLSQRRKHKFFSNIKTLQDWEDASIPVLRSEAEFRNFRIHWLERFKIEIDLSSKGKTLVVTGHHLDDLLETRLIRMIRGTGPEGIGAMEKQNGNFLRPFLDLSRENILSYGKARKVSWQEDPSNEDIDPLRNWLRQKWLPQLEKKHPGALQNFGLSLQRVTETIQGSLDWLDLLWSPEGGLLRQRYIELSAEQKSQAVAHLMRKSGCKSYTENHVKEVVKRLDSPQKEHTFCLLKRDWVVNAEQIIISD